MCPIIKVERISDVQQDILVIRRTSKAASTNQKCSILDQLPFLPPLSNDLERVWNLTDLLKFSWLKALT